MYELGDYEIDIQWQDPLTLEWSNIGCASNVSLEPNLPHSATSYVTGMDSLFVGLVWVLQSLLIVVSVAAPLHFHCSNSSDSGIFRFL